MVDDLRGALLEVEGEEVMLRRRFPSVFFVPNGKQEEFIRLVAEEMGRGVGGVLMFLWSGANSTGKTRIEAEMVVNLSLGVQNVWFDYPFFRDFKRPNRGRLISSQKALEEGLIQELRGSLSEYMAVGYPKKAGHTYDSRWKLRNGSSFDLYTWDMGVVSHAGATLDWLGGDEPGKKEIVMEGLSRLRYGGPFFWGMTPSVALDGGGDQTDIAWLYEQLLKGEVGDSPVHVMYADAEDNCIEHGVRGRIPHDVIESRRAMFEGDEAQLMARLYGRHVFEMGRVLRGWDPEKHVMDPVPLEPGWLRFAALDTHNTKPHVFNYFVLTPWHHLWMTDEIVSDAVPKVLAGQIKELYRLRGWPQVALIDPLSLSRDPTSGTSMYLQLRRHGLAFRPAGREKANKNAGIFKLKEMLEGTEGVPSFRVFRTCPFSISQATRWMVNRRTMEPGKENDDAYENAYRVINVLPERPGSHMDAVRKSVERAALRGGSILPPRREMR